MKITDFKPKMEGFNNYCTGGILAGVPIFRWKRQVIAKNGGIVLEALQEILKMP